jgi:uncharacterized GH25 family protein
MRYSVMKKIFLFALILLFCFSTPIVHAHRLWLNIDDEQARVGQTVRIEIGWGHKFPKDEVIKEDLLHQVYALDSKNEKVPLKRISSTGFEFVPEEEGTYIILADIHPGFLSKTTEGYKLRSKKGLDNVISCFRYDMRAKAIIYGGEKAKMNDRATGDILEIVSLTDTRELKEGDVFRVKVLYDGKPLPFINVNATYEGFSDLPNTFALNTKTDERGVAGIKIPKNGRWMANVMYEVPYINIRECDKYRYNACFTFKVK